MRSQTRRTERRAAVARFASQLVRPVRIAVDAETPARVGSVVG
jgi:hypothetical protein